MDCSKCKRTDVKCCYTCKKDADKCKVYHKCGSDCPEHESRIKTNADKIRSMTDEELAELFSKIDKGWDVICGSYISIKPGVLICGRDDFGKLILQWLQSEAE